MNIWTEPKKFRFYRGKIHCKTLPWHSRCNRQWTRSL